MTRLYLSETYIKLFGSAPPGAVICSTTPISVPLSPNELLVLDAMEQGEETTQRIRKVTGLNRDDFGEAIAELCNQDIVKLTLTDGYKNDTWVIR